MASVKYLTLLLPLTGIFILTGCFEASAPSQWTSQPPMLDAAAEGWRDAPGLQLREINAVVKLSNDSNNLYGRIEIADARWFSIALRQGLFIWFDPLGNKQRRCGFQVSAGAFARPPSSITPTERPPESQFKPGERPRPEPLPKGIQALFLRGEKDLGRLMDLNRTEPPLIRFKESGGRVICEFALPLKFIDYEGQELAATLGKSVNLCFQIKDNSSGRKPNPAEGDMPEDGGGPGQKGMGGPSGQGSPGGGQGMPPRGGMGGGRGGAPGGGQDGMHPREGRGGGLPGANRFGVEPKEVWLKVPLAKP